jgi:hypothetical protein
MSIDIRRHQLSSLVLAGAAAVIVSLSPATGSAHGNGGGNAHNHGCRKVKGDWSSEAVPVPPCTSPIGICTSGQLKGSLKGGTYAFTMNSMTPVPEADAPFVTFFSGTSFVTLRNGHVIRGVDTGAMNVTPPGFFGSGKFTTLLSFVEGGTGYLQIRGTLNFITGGASGDYQGELCPE